MPGVSIHAVDVTRGVPAHGMRVEVFELAPARRRIAEGWLSRSGTFDHAIATEQLRAGPTRSCFTPANSSRRPAWPSRARHS